MPKTVDIEKLVRPNIRDLVPYRSARDDFDTGILLDANENAFGSPAEDRLELNRYPSPAQTPLRERVAAFRGVAADNIFLGVGSDEPIDLLIRIFCEPGRDRIVITPPTYGMYKVSARINDVGVSEAGLDGSFQPVPETIRELTSPQTRLLFLCSPNNPTGNNLDRERVMEILEQFPGIVVIDEAYIDFSRMPSAASLIGRYPNLVVLQTLSKSFGLAGARLGIAISGPEITGYLMKVKAPYNINKLTADAAMKAFDRLGRVQEVIGTIVSEREKLARELNSIPAVEQVFPSDANFLLFRIGQAGDIYRKLAAAGVIVRYRGGEPGCENCLRVTVGTPEENNRFLTTLKEETS